MSGSATIKEVSIDTSPSRDSWLYCPRDPLNPEDDKRIQVSDLLGLVSAADLSGIDYLQFSLTPSSTAIEEGKLRWDSDYGVLLIGLPGENYNLPIGQAMVLPGRVKNTSGSDMSRGQVVYISDVSGQRAVVSLAKADTEGTSSATIALLAEDIPNNQQGYAVTQGILKGTTAEPINTSAYSIGTRLWLSASTAGAWTNSMPASPSHAVIIGKVWRSHATEGEIFIRIMNGWELYELHDVADGLVTPTAGELFAYNAVNFLWEQTPNLVYDFATEELSATSLSVGDTTITGTFLHQNTSNSSTAFRILDSAGTSIFNVNTADQRIDISQAPVKSDDAVNISVITSTTGIESIGLNLLTRVNAGSFNVSEGIITQAADVLGSNNVVVGLTSKASHILGGTGDSLVGLSLSVVGRSGDIGWNILSNNTSAVRCDNYFGNGWSGFNSLNPANMLDCIATGTTVNILKGKLAASHSANAIEIQDSSSSILFNVEPDGEVVIPQDNKAFKVGATITDLQIYSDGTNGILDISSALRLANATTDYINISSTGRLTLVGTARTKREIRLSVSGVEKGVSAPTVALRSIGASGTLKKAVLQFSKTVQQDIYFEIHPNYDQDDSADHEIHLVWVPGAAWTAGNYVWKIEYLVKTEAADLTTGTPTTISADVTPTSATTTIETVFANTIDLNIGQVAYCHLYRDVASDNGDDVGSINLIESEYTVNSLGEAT